MFSIIFTLIALVVCVIHLFKYGIEDRYDIDFLIIFILQVLILIFNIIK